MMFVATSTQRIRWWCWGLSLGLGWLWVVCPAGWGAEVKLIHLRAGVLTNAAVSAVRPQGFELPISGLYLVQFSGALESGWRREVEAMGGDFLRYVPDDAYIVRLRQARLDRLRALGYVHWVGRYSPDYKVAVPLSVRLPGPVDEPVAVRVLSAPGADASELLEVRRQLGSYGRESDSRFGTILSGVLPRSRVGMVASLDSVLWIEPAGRPRLFDEVSTRIVLGSGTEEGDPLGVHDLGYRGKGVVVAVADSGLHRGEVATMHPDLAGRVDAFFQYGGLADASDAQGHGTHVSGILAGNAAIGERDGAGRLYGLGVAPESRLVVQRIFDGRGDFFPPPTFETLTRDAVRAGAVIGLNSWGEDTRGRYDLVAAEFDALVRDADAETLGDQQYVLEVSAGNAGPGERTVGSPAVAKNVIATGASQNGRVEFTTYAQGVEAMADFSSRGPTEDGRIKPDLVAPGTWVASLQSAAASGWNGWKSISQFYQYGGGTSQAGPQVGGAAALFTQYYRESHRGDTPSPALVKAALINSARDMDDGKGGPGPAPNGAEGWGRVDAGHLLGGGRRDEFVDQSVLLRTGEANERRVLVRGGGIPLRVTLAYTDVPALPAAMVALVNDLDLEVVGPDGAVYRGNQMEGGESVAGATGADRVNNVEAVHLKAPRGGEYTVRVLGRRVAEDARRDTAPVDQDFGLVVSGDFPLPGAGLVVLDRGSYTAPGVVGIRVIDHDLAGAPDLTVFISSFTETNAEPVLLTAMGRGGVFTGAVETLSGPMVGDGRLQISNSDLVTVEYFDSSPAGRRVGLARGDLAAPALLSVGVTSRLGQAQVDARFREPVRVRVLYGMGGSLGHFVAAEDLRETHTVPLAGLSGGGDYRFLIEAVDEAGNRAVYDNGGALYGFTAPTAATVLLVDAFDLGIEDQGARVDRSTYLEALEGAGVRYEVWDVRVEGRPGLEDLRPYRVVIWRISDSIWSQSTLTREDQLALSEYVAGGGSFLMASMEILSRIGSVPFRTNVLQVASWAEDVGVPSVRGPDNEPLTGGMSIVLDYSAYADPVLENLGLTPDLADTLVLSTNAAPLFFDTQTGRVVGMRYPRIGQDSVGRVVFLPFPLDAVPGEGEGTNPRAELMRKLMGFLAPGESPVSTIALDQRLYSLPAVVTVEVSDSERAGLGLATVRVHSDLDPVRVIEVGLPETARRGVFRGTVILVDAPVAGGVLPSQVTGKDGTVLWAEYEEGQGGGVFQARAGVDTGRPSIQSVRIEPAYEETVVRWETSEPTDGLVQFGESAFLGRTAYRSEAGETHEVRLSGLQPDRTYYYRVVSRDEAGNVAVDDDGGRLRTFRTLKPVGLPWLETMDGGAEGWTVIDGDDSDLSWGLGEPANGSVGGAHSPPNAWGTNLGGDRGQLVQTYLVSPAIDLTGGNRATLRFWHHYDFRPRSPFDVLEEGKLMIITNVFKEPALLRSFAGDSEGWRAEEVDLSGHLGRVVYLVWEYDLVSFDFEGPEVRSGWAVDDVSVTATNAVLGAVSVANSLRGATVHIRGPLDWEETGLGQVWTGLPPGAYSAWWEPVRFYRTPDAQTLELVGTNRIDFSGVYTYLDVNQNGISDEWEAHYFGGTTPRLDPVLDSDQDGASNVDEFRAGTDPTNPGSVLRMGAPLVGADQSVRLEWPAEPGYSYRLLGSTNLVEWRVLMDWTRASDRAGGVEVPPSRQANARFFRLEVSP